MKVAFWKGHMGWGGGLWSLCWARGPVFCAGFCSSKSSWVGVCLRALLWVIRDKGWNSLAKWSHNFSSLLYAWMVFLHINNDNVGILALSKVCSWKRNSLKCLQILTVPLDLGPCGSLKDECVLCWMGDVSKPCHQRWAISQEASLEIWVVPLDREKERERERGETQNGLFHNRLTDLLALSS